MRYYYTVQKVNDRDEYKLKLGKILGPSVEDRQPDTGYEWKKVASSYVGPDDMQAVLSDLRQKGELQNQPEAWTAPPRITDTDYMIRTRLG